MRLSECKILRDLPSPVDEMLNGAARERWYEAGEPIIRQGEEADGLCFLLEGRARVTIGANNIDIHLHEFQSGDHFGELSIIDGQRRSATVIAATRCRVAALDRHVIVAAMHEAPTLRLALLRQLAQLIRTEQERIATLSAEEILQRVLRVLLELAEPQPTGGGRWHIPRLPSHKELARAAGTSPDIVAQVMGQLVGKGLVKRHRLALILTDRRRLKEEAQSLALIGSPAVVRP